MARRTETRGCVDPDLRKIIAGKFPEFRAAAPRNDDVGQRKMCGNKKRTNSRWSRAGINYPANRPDPDDPGGLGAEESGVERTGPTRAVLVATQKGVRWAEVGRHYDSTNDAVTLHFLPARGPGQDAGRESGRACHGPLAGGGRRRNHVLDGMIPKGAPSGHARWVAAGVRKRPCPR